MQLKSGKRRLTRPSLDGRRSVCISQARIYLKKLEGIESPPDDRHPCIKIHKVLKAIKRLDAIRREGELHVKERAASAFKKALPSWTSGKGLPLLQLRSTNQKTHRTCHCRFDGGGRIRAIAPANKRSRQWA